MPYVIAENKSSIFGRWDAISSDGKKEGIVVEFVSFFENRVCVK